MILGQTALEIKAVGRHGFFLDPPEGTMLSERCDFQLAFETKQPILS